MGVRMTTKDIHAKIIAVCTFLRTRYEGKKHGGYNIYEDDKIIASCDTYVPNVNLNIKLPNNTNESVFSCSYSGDFANYHAGKWELYLNDLYEKACLVMAQKEEERRREVVEKERKDKAPASKEADSVFT